MARIALLFPFLCRDNLSGAFGYALADALEETHDVDVICARCHGVPPVGVRVVVVGDFGEDNSIKRFYFVLKAELARRRGHYDLAVALGPALSHDVRIPPPFPNFSASIPFWVKRIEKSLPRVFLKK